MLGFSYIINTSTVSVCGHDWPLCWLATSSSHPGPLSL